MHDKTQDNSTGHNSTGHGTLTFIWYLLLISSKMQKSVMSSTIHLQAPAGDSRDSGQNGGPVKHRARHETPKHQHQRQPPAETAAKKEDPSTQEQGALTTGWELFCRTSLEVCVPVEFSTLMAMSKAGWHAFEKTNLSSASIYTRMKVTRDAKGGSARSDQEGCTARFGGSTLFIVETSGQAGLNFMP